jgi:hypothetical protein
MPKELKLSPFDLTEGPYIVRTVKGPYDPSKKIKRWIDTRANDSSNTQQIFAYHTYIRGPQGGVEISRFEMGRAEASLANIPGTADKNLQEWTVPMRYLRTGEDLTISPEGDYVIVTVSLAEVLRVCNEILGYVIK